MEENLSQEQVNLTLNYYLFSVTLKVDGLRIFKDIPIYSHKLVFPSKINVYKIACNYLNINAENQEYWNDFAVLNIHKFEDRLEYLSYIGQLNVNE